MRDAREKRGNRRPCSSSSSSGSSGDAHSNAPAPTTIAISLQLAHILPPPSLEWKLREMEENKKEGAVGRESSLLRVMRGRGDLGEGEKVRY